MGTNQNRLQELKGEIDALAAEIDRHLEQSRRYKAVRGVVFSDQTEWYDVDASGYQGEEPAETGDIRASGQ